MQNKCRRQWPRSVSRRHRARLVYQKPRKEPMSSARRVNPPNFPCYERYTRVSDSRSSLSSPLGASFTSSSRDFQSTTREERRVGGEGQEKNTLVETPRNGNCPRARRGFLSVCRCCSSTTYAHHGRQQWPMNIETGPGCLTTRLSDAPSDKLPSER